MSTPIDQQPCPNCGQPVPPGGAVCPGCGTPLQGGVAGGEAFDRQLAELAVRLRLLTTAQAAGALTHPSAPERPGAPFLAAGLLTQAQIDHLVSTLRFKEERLADSRLGQLAVARGWIRADQVASALEQQKRLFVREQRSVPLRELLIEHGQLTVEQCDTLQTELAHRRAEQAQPEPAAAPIELTVAADRLSASTVLAEDAPTPAPKQVRAALTARGIVYGLDEAAIARLCSGSVRGEPITLAQGRAPVPPRHAEIEYLFDLHPLKGASQSEDGTIDFRNRGEIPQVTAGTVLARRNPPVPGEPGMDIFGDRLIPKTPKDRALNVGKGAALAADRATVTAAIDGHPSVSATGLIAVFPEYTIDGDLGYSTGHVDFHGRVVVTGTVRSGFRVHCGELEAQEIEGAEVQTEGDVRVSGGVIGARMRCGGSVQVKYLHQAHLEVMGDVVVAREIVDSEVETSGALLGERCSILSSRISARNGIYVKEVGSESSAPCRFAVGIDERVQHEAERIEAALEERRTVCDEAVARIAEAQGRRSALDGEIGRAAQAQDKLRVRQRALESAGPGGKTELEQLKAQEARQEAALNGLFADQDRLSTEIDAAEAQLTADRATIETLTGELEQLQAWARDNVGEAVVVADLLRQQTLIKTPHLETRIAVDRKRVRLEERQGTDPEGKTFWQLATVDGVKPRKG